MRLHTPSGQLVLKAIRRVSISILAAITLPGAGLAQAKRVGAELQVSTYTVSHQWNPSVAATAAGDFVVVWSSYGQDGSDYGVFASRFSSAGELLGTELQVNVFTIDDQDHAALTRDADGDFIVVWDSYQDGSYKGIFARRFSSAGDAQGIEFQVNEYTTGFQYNPSVVADANGDFVVAWESSHPHDGYASGLFARRFSSSGAALATEFQVNTYTHSFQADPALAAHAGGNVVMAWVSYTQDGSSNGIFARLFSSAGLLLATEFQVNVYTPLGQGQPSVAVDTDGGFVVVWNSSYQDGSGFGVFARRFSSDGDPVGPEIQVNVYTTSHQSSPSIAMHADGGFVVAWGSTKDYGGSNDTIFARRFSSTGDPVGSEFQVNDYTTDFQAGPSVAAAANGDFVVAWNSYRQDGSGGGVFAQRFSTVLAVADIDGNGSAEPLTDGLLFLRYLFDFTGSTLTAGAVDLQSCTRCDASSIASHLASLGSVLDIDADGELGPLTDGLLLLRFLFDLTDGALTTGAVDADDCTRCDSAAIVPYLETLL